MTKTKDTRPDFFMWQYKRLILPGILSAAMPLVSYLITNVIGGNVLGETALSAMSVYVPINCCSMFVGGTLGYGVAIHYTNLVGKTHNRQAYRTFGQGVILSIVIGLVLFAVMWAVTPNVANIFGCSDAIAEKFTTYFAFQKWAVAIYPAYMLFYYIVFYDGDSKLCLFSNFIYILVQVVATLGLLQIGLRMEAISLGYTACLLISTLIVCLHFLKKTNSVKLQFNFSAWGLKKICQAGVPVSLSDLCSCLFTLFLTQFISIGWGSEYLTVYTSAEIVDLFTMFSMAFGMAAGPAIGVYFGEENFPAIRHCLKKSLKVITIFSFALGALLFFSAPIFPAMCGVKTKEIFDLSVIAIKILSFDFVFYALYYLYRVYFPLVNQAKMGVVLVVLHSLVLPILMTFIFGYFFDFNFIWVGLALTQLICILIMVVICLVKFGKSNFWCTLPHPKHNSYTFCFDLDYQYFSLMLKKTIRACEECGLTQLQISEINLLLEQVFGNIADLNKPNKNVICECNILIGIRGLRIVMRDNGKIEQMTDEQPIMNTKRAYQVACLMRVIKDKCYLVTSSYNREVFEFKRQ